MKDPCCLRAYVNSKLFLPFLSFLNVARNALVNLRTLLSRPFVVSQPCLCRLCVAGMIALALN